MNNKKSREDETKKLTYVVVFMSIIVLILFSLGPTA